MTIDKITPIQVEIPLPGQRPVENDAIRDVLPINDSSEISEEAMEVLDTIGSADGLPGEGEGKIETGKFGFCQNCGSEHQLAAARANKSDSEEDTAPVIGGQEIPDLHEIAFGDPAASSETETHSDNDGHGHAEGDSGGGEASMRDPATTTATGETLSEEEQKEVEKLRDRDREVRAHEQAHAAAGGSHVRGGVKYEYQTGPDGRRYAVGGEVSIDTSPVPGDPQKTIQKAQQIRRAAMAPAEPSGQDRQVAAAASQMEAEARQELIEERSNPEGEGDESIAAADGAVQANPSSSDSGSTESDAESESRDRPIGRGIESNETHESSLEPDTSPEPPASPTLPDVDPPEIDEAEASEGGLGDLVDDIEERAESGEAASVSRIVSLSYAEDSGTVGSMVDFTS